MNQKSERDSEIAVLNANITIKALSVDPSFKNTIHKVLCQQVYPFLALDNFSFCIAKTKGQKLTAYLLSVYKFFASKNKCKFQQEAYQSVSPGIFVNTDETAVYLKEKGKFTLHPGGNETFSVRCIWSNDTWMIVFYSVARDAAKLPLFSICNCQPNERIQSSVKNILPIRFYRCFQLKGWMNDKSLLLRISLM